MKLLVVVIVTTFVSMNGCLAQVESGNSLSALFITGGNSVASALIEGQKTDNLRDILVNETAKFIENVIANLERQVNVQSHLQLAMLKLAQENFNNQIEQLPVDATADVLDVGLQFLNEKIVEALNLIPKTLGGNAVVKPNKSKDKDKGKGKDKDKDKGSSDSNKLPSSSEQNPTVHTLLDLTNNMAQLLETDISALYKFQKKLLTAGYKDLNGAYSGIQERFRTTIINDNIFPVLQSIVQDVRTKQEIAQAHVNDITWNKFLTLNDQLTIIGTNIGVIVPENTTTIDLKEE